MTFLLTCVIREKDKFNLVILLQNLKKELKRVFIFIKYFLFLNY